MKKKFFHEKHSIELKTLAFSMLGVTNKELPSIFFGGNDIDFYVHFG